MFFRVFHSVLCPRSAYLIVNVIFFFLLSLAKQSRIESTGSVYQWCSNNSSFSSTSLEPKPLTSLKLSFLPCKNKGSVGFSTQALAARDTVNLREMQSRFFFSPLHTKCLARCLFREHVLIDPKCSHSHTKQNLIR